jgi:hypothetical protein
MNDALNSISFVILFIAVLAIAGFVNIWALNTLFPALNIPYTIETWFASMIIFSSITSFKNRNK